jgi:hypothetical protein
MVTEEGAIAAATPLFRGLLPDVAVKKVVAFTLDGGISWMVRFHCELRREEVDETGAVSAVIESNETRTLFVDGETGYASWPEAR